MNIHVKFPAVLVFLLTVFCAPFCGANWPEDCEKFVAKNLTVLRETRSSLVRPDFSFSQANEVLDFIEKSKNTYGSKELSSTPHTTALIVDVCDIVNLQHPDFKNRYDIFVEQWDGNKQLPFSLFTFDRIAQVFHFCQDLFDTSDGSAYRRVVKQILDNELHVLREAFRWIEDLDNYTHHRVNVGVLPPGRENNIKDLDLHLNQMCSSDGKIKASEQRAIRALARAGRVTNLLSLSAMAHDYLTLGRIEKAVETVAAIPGFSKTEQREAFLAGMIQIGELATNKNLSRFVCQSMPMIPWAELVHCRDSIEHQDEHGFDTYFSNITDPSGNSIDFGEWANELKTLRVKVLEAKKSLWGDNHKRTFEIWLEGELSGPSVYGIVVDKRGSPPLDKKVKKVFRQTSLFKSNKCLWSGLINGTAQITYQHLAKLMTERAQLIAGTPSSTETKHADSYTEVGNYLWIRVKNEAIHLADTEGGLLVNLCKNHFGTTDISQFCLALLTMDQPSLTQQAYSNFLRSALAAHIDCQTVITIFKHIRPEMPITRRILLALPFDNTRDLNQTDRKALAKLMFKQTTTHLHNLAHGPDFETRMYEEILTIPMRFAFDEALASDQRVVALKEKIGRLHKTHASMDKYGYANLTLEGQRLVRVAILQSGIKFDFPKTTPELLAFGKEVMDRFYRAAHRVDLPDAIRTEPTTYLASVYSLSVGMGALKEWVNREAAPPPADALAVAKLRDGRNFLAHGDLLRELGRIQLEEMLQHLLENHLEHCEKLQFNG